MMYLCIKKTILYKVIIKVILSFVAVFGRQVGCKQKTEFDSVNDVTKIRTPICSPDRGFCDLADSEISVTSHGSACRWGQPSPFKIFWSLSPSSCLLYFNYKKARKAKIKSSSLFSLKSGRTILFPISSLSLL